MKKLILALLVAFGGFQTATAMDGDQCKASSSAPQQDDAPLTLEKAMELDNVFDKDYFMSVEKDVNEVSCRGMTPLFRACTYAYLNTARWLLENGASTSIDQPDRNERTSLLLACSQRNPNLALVKLLLENGASINQPHRNGNTPLLQACSEWNPNLALVKLLLNNGAYESVNRQTSNGWTAFGVATDDSKRLLIVYKLAHENAEFLKILQDGPSNEDGSYSDAQKIAMLNALTAEQQALIKDLYTPLMNPRMFTDDSLGYLMNPFASDTDIVDAALHDICDQWLTDRNHIKELIRQEYKRIECLVVAPATRDDNNKLTEQTVPFLLWSLKQIKTPSKEPRPFDEPRLALKILEDHFVGPKVQDEFSLHLSCCAEFYNITGERTGPWTRFVNPPTEEVVEDTTALNESFNAWYDEQLRLEAQEKEMQAKASGETNSS